jgi:negative regulator of sigma E activity
VNGAEVAEQPLAFVTVTVTVCVAASVTLCVNAPLDHAYAAPEEATSVTEAPWQNAFPLSEVMFATGFAFTTTDVTAEVAEQPFALVTVTVTSDVLLTVID